MSTRLRWSWWGLQGEILWWIVPDWQNKLHVPTDPCGSRLWKTRTCTHTNMHAHTNTNTNTGRNPKQEVCDWDSHPQPPFFSLRDNKSNRLAIARPHPFRALITLQPDSLTKKATPQACSDLKRWRALRTWRKWLSVICVRRFCSLPVA